MAVDCFYNRGRALGTILSRVGRTLRRNYAKCKAVADRRGVSVFGLDDQTCWSGDNGANSYDIYGNSGRCQTRGVIGAGYKVSGTVFVYEKDSNGKQTRKQVLLFDMMSSTFSRWHCLLTCGFMFSLVNLLVVVG